jgi:2-polyprenyl-6-methoxyphenol hydroxylase-like FAD-dependent oxidoreductase
MANNHYDVIIIGGRNAGSSLALRLAGNDLKILLVDRATFPSLPSVPSSPIFHPGTMRLLDELGIQESEYTLPGSKVEHYVMDFVNYFHADFPTSRMGLDRNYCYGIDRNLFDTVLWERARRVPGVTARDGFSVMQVTKDENGKVNGIVGKSTSGTPETFTADLVVGADGRFSFAAREFGAKVTEEMNEFTGASYHTEWENVDDYSPELPNSITMYINNKGFFLIIIPIAERKYIVCTYMRSADAHFGAQGIEAAYLEGLQSIPHMWNRLKHARRVTEVVGVRPIANGYREAFGAGWALVGDAVHYKDPIDGQGIYDALLEAKILAQSILDWKKQGMSWEQAGANYQQQMLDETHPMFLQTVAQVKQKVYTEIPEFILKTYMRYLLNNPGYQTQFLRYLARAIDPADFSVEPSISPQILIKGLAGDIRKRFKAS